MENIESFFTQLFNLAPSSLDALHPIVQATANLWTEPEKWIDQNARDIVEILVVGLCINAAVIGIPAYYGYELYLNYEWSTLSDEEKAERLRLQAAAEALKRVQDLQNGNIQIPADPETPTTTEELRDSVEKEVTEQLT